MSAYKSRPIWKRGMLFAHAVYAALEAAGSRSTGAGVRLRKAAVSVPSLIGEAFLDSTGRGDEALRLAVSRLSEVERLLSGEAGLAGIAEGDRRALLAEVDGLKGEIEVLRLGRGSTVAQ